MTNPAEEALDSGVPTADDDKSVWGESAAKGEKNPLDGWGSGWQPPRPRG